MQNKIDSFAGKFTIGEGPDVAFHELKPGPRLFTDDITNSGQVMRESGDKTVQTNDFETVTEKGFDEVRADKTRRAGNQPATACGRS